MSTVYRYIAALKAPTPVPQYVKHCRAILAKMTNNPAFASPTPPLAKVAADLDALDAAEQATRKGPKGLVAERDDKLRVVKSDMRLLKGYTQSVADENAAQSKAIIESAGMTAGRRAIPTKPDLGAKHGKVPGTVLLHAKAVRVRASYQWQMSTDQQAWTDLPDTVTASTSASGLAPATQCYFRVRTLTVLGLSEWSTVASIIAH